MVYCINIGTLIFCYKLYFSIVLNIHWKDWCWNWNSSTLTTWCEELTHWKRPWCWERLKAGGEGDGRGWGGWMVSQTQWTWVWVGSGSWWWTGKTGVLQSTGSQRVGHDWGTEQNGSDIQCWFSGRLWFSVAVVRWPFLVQSTEAAWGLVMRLWWGERLWLV